MIAIDADVSKQKEAEGHFKSQVDNCQEYWMELRKQRKSYEWLMEKKQKEKAKLQDQREQKQMDEFSTLLYSRQRR